MPWLLTSLEGEASMSLAQESLVAQALLTSYQNSVVCDGESATAKYLFLFRGLAGHPYGVFFMLLPGPSPGAGQTVPRHTL